MRSVLLSWISSSTISMLIDAPSTPGFTTAGERSSSASMSDAMGSGDSVANDADRPKTSGTMVSPREPDRAGRRVPGGPQVAGKSARPRAVFRSLSRQLVPRSQHVQFGLDRKVARIIGLPRRQLPRVLGRSGTGDDESRDVRPSWRRTMPGHLHHEGLGGSPVPVLRRA